ncbi:MAG: phosphoribosyltransferase [Thermoproteota archaeon]|jgi:predicted phosphoribosyltransferase
MIITDYKLYNKFNLFVDRHDAGKKLANFIKDHIQGNELVYAIPAGGIPVAKSLCKILNLKFKIALVSKIVLPWNTEVGYGAVSIEGDVELNEGLVRFLRLSKEVINKGIEETKNKIRRRFEILPKELTILEKTENSILVDDGIASGYTMLVALKMLKRYSKNVSIATPTASKYALDLLENQCDKIFVLNIRDIYPFAVADAYEYWYDLSEEDIIKEATDDV